MISGRPPRRHEADRQGLVQIHLPVQRRGKASLPTLHPSPALKVGRAAAPLNRKMYLNQALAVSLMAPWRPARDH